MHVSESYFVNEFGRGVDGEWGGGVGGWGGGVLTQRRLKYCGTFYEIVSTFLHFFIHATNKANFLGEKSCNQILVY